MDQVECVVVGAGAVGLAVARALALDGRDVLVVERETRIGTGVSSRSSEVIHAGLYYTPGSLKARLCVAGRDQLWAYCATHGVETRRCGKLILAVSPDQVGGLEAILDNAAQSGVDDLRLLDGAAARRLEPALACTAALLSPSTGVFDSHAYMLSLQGDSEARGTAFAFGTTVTGIKPEANRLRLRFDRSTEPALEARLVVNAAGLYAGVLAKATEGLKPEHAPEIRLAKGSYFALTGRAPFSHLIYPRPEPGGLGVHLTLDLGGGARFGPDVEWVDHPDYAVDPALAPAFYKSVRAWWPGLEDGRLSPAYAGVRPKLSGPGEPAADFRIDGPDTHGVAGLINLFGIESPGLTSSLALADEVLAIARKSLDS